MTTATPAGRNDWAVIGLVSGAHCFSHIYILGLPTLLAFMVTDPGSAHLGLNFAKAGLVVSVFSLASGFLQFFIGVFADRIGAKPILLGGMALLSGAMALIGFADSYPMVLALAFLAGLGNSVFHPVDYSIMGATVSQRRLPMAYSIHTFAGSIGFALGPVIAGFLAAGQGWRVAFHIAGIVGLSMVIVLWTQRRRLADSTPTKHTPAAGGRGVGGRLADTLGLGIILTPAILLIFVFYTLAGGLSIGLSSATPAGLNKLWDFDLKDAAIPVTAWMIGGALGTLAGGLMVARFKRFDLSAFIGYSVSSVILFVIATQYLPFLVVVAAFFAAGFMTGTITPSRDMMVRSVTPQGHSGKVFGFVASGFDVGGIIFPPAFGWLIDHGRADWVFLGASILMVLTFLAAFLAMRTRRPAAVGAAAE